MLVAKGLDNRVFDYIDPWGETLVYIAWVVQSSYQRTFGSTLVQAVFGRDMIFNLGSLVNSKFITAKKQQKVEIDNV